MQTASPTRYDRMQYRRCGRSGLLLPAVSLGAWLGIGSYVQEQTSRDIVLRAFDLGITHFDLANMYGSKPGTSEELFGKIAAELPRHELVVSTKAGAGMFKGPYGQSGSRKSIIENCNASLKRLKLDHVDIFYSHCRDPETPMEETLGAMEDLVRQGKALYTAISNYPDPYFSRAIAIVREQRWHPLVLNQPRYHMLARTAEQEILPTAHEHGVGVIVYCPLAQGLLTNRYLNGVPSDSRAALAQKWMSQHAVKPEIVDGTRKLDEIAKQRGQSLAQMALAWLLKDQRVTSVLIGASSVRQVEDNVGCLRNLAFSAGELAAIDAVCATLSA